MNASRLRAGGMLLKKIGSYALGIIIESTAVLVLSGLALLLMFLVKTIMK
ncbi:MAG: hypothetical protein PHP64_03800 [Actinomycetota bacterium]|nr:hypothetical protein [Actinomycetota bacterium]